VKKGPALIKKRCGGKVGAAMIGSAFGHTANATKVTGNARCFIVATKKNEGLKRFNERVGCKQNGDANMVEKTKKRRTKRLKARTLGFRWDDRDTKEEKRGKKQWIFSILAERGKVGSQQNK